MIIFYRTVPNIRGIYIRKRVEYFFVIDGGPNKKLCFETIKYFHLTEKKCSSMKEYRKHKDYFLIGPIKLRITRAKKRNSKYISVEKKRYPSPPLDSSLDSWNDVVSARSKRRL